MNHTGNPRAVGVLALQGGVAEHAEMLEQLGTRVVLVRRESDLLGPDGPRIDALVLPGGESSTQDRLLRLFDMTLALRSVIEEGVPTLGTCAGLILLARSVLDPAPGQKTLGILDVVVRRNAFGTQVASREAEFTVQAAGVIGQGQDKSIRAALIRAPEIVSVGVRGRVISTVNGRILGVTSMCPDASPVPEPRYSVRGQQHSLGTVTGIAFHPEIAGDPAFHRALLAQTDPVRIRY